jgi:hypothetical protein
MKKRNPSGGQNGQLVHWWLLFHSGRGGVALKACPVVAVKWTFQCILDEVLRSNSVKF